MGHLFDSVKPTETTAQVTAQTVEAKDNAGTEGKTPKQIKKAEKRDARKKAFEVIFNYIKDGKDIPAEVRKAAELVKPTFFGVAVQGGFAKKEHPACVEKIMQILGTKTFEDIKVGTTFDEMKVFQALKAGRKEMRSICIGCIKHPDDKGAIYISFDAVKGIYKIESIGAEPEGWTGYRPADKDAEADAE